LSSTENADSMIRSILSGCTSIHSRIAATATSAAAVE